MGAQFNRIAGDAHTASKFRLSIAAFHGDPVDAANMWENRKLAAAAFAEKGTRGGQRPREPGNGWIAATSVPSEADFGVVEIRAIAPADVPPGIDPFPGHFADLITQKFACSCESAV